MGSHLSQLTDLQLPSLLPASGLSGPKDLVFQDLTGEIQAWAPEIMQKRSEVEEDVKQCEEELATSQYLGSWESFLENLQRITRTVHDLTLATSLLLGEVANRLDLLSNEDTPTGVQLAKELLAQGQDSGVNFAELLGIATLKRLKQRVDRLVLGLGEDYAGDEGQSMVEDLRVTLAEIEGIWKDVFNHKYYVICITSARTSSGGLENLPFDLLSDLQPPMLPHLDDVSGSKQVVFEEIFDHLQPYTRFQQQASRDLDSDLKLCEKSLLAQRPRSLLDLREQIDQGMGLCARLSDLTKGALAALAEVFARVDVLGVSTSSGDSLIKEFASKAESDGNSLHESLMVATLETYQTRLSEHMNRLELLLREIASQSPDFPSVLMTISDTNNLISAIASLWKVAKAHKFYFVLTTQREVDERDLKMMRSMPVISVGQTGWHAFIKPSLAEQNLKSNQIPGWEASYVRLKDLYSLVHSNSPTNAILTTLGEDLNDRVLPKYLDSGKELLTQVSSLPKLNNSANLREFLSKIQEIITTATAIIRFLTLNLDIIQDLFAHLSEFETDLSDFVLSNIVKTDGKWNSLRTISILRQIHVDLLRKVDYIQLIIQRYSDDLTREELENASKLREKLLAIGNYLDSIALHALFDHVIPLRPRQQAFKSVTQEIDISALNMTGTNPTQRLLQMSLAEDEAVEENQERGVLMLFLCLGCAVYSFMYYSMVMPAKGLARDLEQTAAYAPLFVCLANIGGLLGSGTLRQWVKSSYYEPLRFTMIVRLIGNAGILLSMAVSSQSFTILARVLVGVGNPTFLALYFLHCGFKKRDRESPRIWFALSQILGTGLGFLTSGILCTYPWIFPLNNTILLIIIFILADVILLALLMIFCPPVQLLIPVPTIRAHTDQQKVVLSGVAFGVPMVLWECLLLIAPMVLMGGFGSSEVEIGLWMLLACGLQFLCSVLQPRLSFTIKTHWTFLTMILCLCLVPLGFVSNYSIFLLILCGIAVASKLALHPGYSILRAEPPFSENGSWWTADFAMIMALQAVQFLAGIWAAVATEMGASSTALGVFLPALVLVLGGGGTVAVLAPKWPFMENPFN